MSLLKLAYKYVLLLFFITCKPIYADTITIAADVWCPINCQPGSDKPGIMVEIAQTVFSEHGHKVKYVTMPWSRTLNTVRRGELNAAIGAYKEDAPDFVFPEHEQARLAFNFYVLNYSPWQYKGTDSLAKIKLGVIKDYSYLETLDAYIENYADDSDRLNIAYGNGALTKNVKLLMSGYIDTVIATDLVLQHLLSELGYENQLKLAGKGSNVEKAYIAFSPNHPNSKRYAKILSDGMTALRASGKLKTILARYGVQDWQ